MAQPPARRDVRAGHENLVQQTTQAAREAGGIPTATLLTGFVSLLALAFSGVSLYQTVLKQAQLSLYVPETISYTRDPNGSFEVIAVPITVVNSGARDGVVSAMTLKVTNAETGRGRMFRASFFAGPGYFSTKEDFQAGQTRPKSPFTPMTVTGRSGHSETVLFYPREFSKERVIAKEGTFSFELASRIQEVDEIAFVDGMFQGTNTPLRFTAKLPAVSRFFDGQMMTGKSVRLFVDENS